MLPSLELALYRGAGVGAISRDVTIDTKDVRNSKVEEHREPRGKRGGRSRTEAA